jgi:hypothetical protein
MTEQFRKADQESYESEMSEEQKRIDGLDDQDFVQALERYIEALLKTK